MKLKLLWMLLLMSLIACSSNNTMDEDFSDEIVVGDEESVLEEEESEDEIVAEEEIAEEGEEYLALEGEEYAANEQEEQIAQEVVVNTDISESVEESKFAYYQVQKGDTLMLVAFKIYGDYKKWRKVYQLNQVSLNNSTEITTGYNLKYQVPEEKFQWNPVGNPLLIKTGDTLGTISKDVYKKSAYWKFIYENNKPIIRDPNLIFAGFTIYYKDLTQEMINNHRGLSSK